MTEEELRSLFSDWAARHNPAASDIFELFLPVVLAASQVSAHGSPSECESLDAALNITTTTMAS